MNLRVVGAGVGRTGTNSLKVALEQLLGGPCYHMFEVMTHPEHVPLWHQAVRGELEDWDGIFADYVAAVDWPVASFWPELVEANPDAVVLLSTRDSAETWWKSAHNTIFTFMDAEPPPEMQDWFAMVVDMMRTRFTDQLDDEAAAKAAYEAHNDAVRRAVPPERLLEWQPSDGWEPICAALDVAVPDEPFPVTNTTEEFLKMREEMTGGS